MSAVRANKAAVVLNHGAFPAAGVRGQGSGRGAEGRADGRETPAPDAKEEEPRPVARRPPSQRRLSQSSRRRRAPMAAAKVRRGPGGAGQAGRQGPLWAATWAARASAANPRWPAGSGPVEAPGPGGLEDPGFRERALLARARVSGAACGAARDLVACRGAAITAAGSRLYRGMWPRPPASCAVAPCDAPAGVGDPSPVPTEPFIHWVVTPGSAAAIGGGSSLLSAGRDGRRGTRGGGGFVGGSRVGRSGAAVL